MDIEHLSVRRAALELGRSPTTIFENRKRRNYAPGGWILSVYGRDGKQYPARQHREQRERDQILIRMRDAGKTIRQIAAESGWSRGTVAKALAGHPKPSTHARDSV